MKPITSKQESNSAIRKNDVAVIGISGKFPGANNYKEFWKNLKEGKSGIQEVPANRWNWEEFWGDPQTEKNKSNSKWGGFLEDVDKFDPYFFGLSAKEAERMDPQQRIMLQLTWECFEDAGIRPSFLSGKKVGVFLGVFNFDYKELQEREKHLSIEAHHSTGTASAIIANRISYYFNFRGPSIPIDTACSSSLNAIHSSVQSLLNGECSMAIAGGINLLLTPTRHISFSKTGMLSPTGSCKTFDDSADGYVRGEGAGLVLLKPLEQALLDNDRIYGVIKGSAINHGGKTYSLTYPNPEAQKDVILEAQKMAGVSAESIGYIEAHGTGTPKGDPIEYKGLTDAFQFSDSSEKTEKSFNYCGLGSVKTNIGHLEAAAGIAGLIKVLMSLKHKQLPGLQNFKQLNHRISLEGSPFYLVTALKEWKPLRYQGKKILPRRAGVSSFGFGGTNAHIVVEEAPAIKKVQNKKIEKTNPFYLVCLSAKSDESLLKKEQQLAQWLAENPETSIEDICKTLSLGREHFQKRTCLIVEHTQDLQEKLVALSEQEVKGCFRNLSTTKKKETLQQFHVELAKLIAQTLDSNQEISKEDYHQKLTVLAELYLNGYECDWEWPWFGNTGSRIALPTYPFALESYWIPELELEPAKDFVQKIVLANIHPLLGKNISDFRGQSFSTTLTGGEFFVKDHVVKEKKVLPGVAYLEMVRAALEESVKGLTDGEYILSLKNVIWAKPIVVEKEAVEVQCSLAIEDDVLLYEIFSQPSDEENEKIVYSQGTAYYGPKNEYQKVDIEKLRHQPNYEVSGKEHCYGIFREMGLDYGQSHQALEEVYVANNQLIAKLSLPAIISYTKTKFVLHPSMMDASLQAALLFNQKGKSNATYLPFALDHLEILKSCEAEMWAIITSTNDDFNTDQNSIRRLNIELTDQEGNVCVKMQGFTFRLSESAENKKHFNKSGEESGLGTLLFTPQWKEKVAPDESSAQQSIKQLVFICELKNVSEHQLKEELPEVQFVLLEGAQTNIGERFQSYTRKVFEEVQGLLKGKPKGKILVQMVIQDHKENCLFAGLAGLLNTAQLENPNFTGQLIQVSPKQDLTKVLKENAPIQPTNQIRYRDGKRSVLEWKEVNSVAHGNKSLWKEKGIYLITGGAGGLGFIFSKEIASKVKKPTIILTGRSPINENIRQQIETLMVLGATAEYKQLDVTDKRSVAGFIQNILKEFEGLDGIIHGAGIIKDNFIIKKDKEEVEEVLSPKVLGVTYLDEATKGIALDFFISFSSIVGALGNVGQADYATANAYLDQFAHYRNSLVSLKERSGHTISINWPLWKDGGMQLDQSTEQVMLEQMSMNLLETASGIEAFYEAWDSKYSQVLVAPGNVNKLREKFLGQPAIPIMETPAKNKEVNNQVSTESSLSLVSEQESIDYFKGLLSATIKRPVAQIDSEAPMEEYGIDSVMVLQLTNQLERVFGTLPKTLFFEYQNIHELTHYFLENYSKKLAEILGKENSPKLDNLENSLENDVAEVVERSVKSFNSLPQARFMLKQDDSKQSKSQSGKKSTALDIAIVGIAGRYPQADNLEEFWNNLKGGKDCITEIPEDRWDYRLFFNEDKEKEGKSYSKWGGFINDVDKFDPLFFNISPMEAERMDPQERLFLQCVYETLEDAGYTRSSLTQNKHFGLGNQVGVYVGVMYEEYQLFGAQEALSGRPVALWGLPSSIANRVSYFCDFHGPSMAIDTMCSSSLTAIHLACESIIRGKCEMAIAGGVNVSVHPNKYLFLSQGRFASSAGHCESFGKGGDGYVPGEGVGAVLLKPLADAIAQGDHIYGIIKSTAINHGGKTNGYTVPNPKAQAGVISNAFKEAGIDPRSISYLEAHGTGTSLGDPIEILGLNKTFEEFTSDKQFCSIGSAKSNIGHLESAAGIAGLTKVLLQLKYQQIVPSLHSATLNPNIDFENSPFVVQQNLAEWKRPQIPQNGETKEYPRRAGISSFGAGGANAHIIIEEYIPGQPVKKDNTSLPAMILLSGKDEVRLKEQAGQLLSAVDQKSEYWKISDHDLTNLAYTLQVGREHMEYRLGVLVTSIAELKEKLQDFISGNENSKGLFISGSKSSLNPANDSESISSWIGENKYDKILTSWGNGLKIDWKKLYKDSSTYSRISLPTYPFKKDRYWIGEVQHELTNATTGKKAPVIHPLLHENISDLAGQRFMVAFTGEEFYLKDHVVKGKKILPAVAYLEMVREAVMHSIRSIRGITGNLVIKNVAWLQPIVVEENGLQIQIELFLYENDTIGFEIFKNAEDEVDRDIFCQGTASLNNLLAIQDIGEAGIEVLKKACGERIFSKEECYGAFEAIGFNYGDTHRGLQKIYVGQNNVLAKITLPTGISESADTYKLHPSIMDAALQASLMWNYKDLPEMYLPFAAQEIEVYQEVTSEAWVSVKSNFNSSEVERNKERLLNIDIFSVNGELLVRFKGITFKAPSSLGFAKSEKPFDTHLLFPVWKQKELAQFESAQEFKKHIVVVCGLRNISKELSFQNAEVEIIALEAPTASNFRIHSIQLFEKIRNLIKERTKGKVFIQVLVPLEGEGSLYAGIGGLLKTVAKENPEYRSQIIKIRENDSPDEIKKKIFDNKLSSLDTEVRYINGNREVLGWEFSSNQSRADVKPWKDRGIYLITGGAGGLGYIFAMEIAKNTKEATLVLTGRSSLNSAVQDKLELLQKSGVKAEYKQVDVTDELAVQKFIQTIHTNHGSLNGILHSAGVIKDNLLVNKTTEEWNKVLKPKVNGIHYLDSATKATHLDFFIFFSSITGAVGNPGQADYATANAFMDDYAYYRNALKAKGERWGQTLSINWPLWKDGGMQVDQDTESYLLETMGIVPLETSNGIEALYQALFSGQSQVMIVQGDRERIAENIINPKLSSGSSPSDAFAINSPDTKVMEEAINYFKKLLSSVIKLPVDKIKANVSMEDYGIDSVMVMKMTGKLEKVFGTLSKTLFFEYQNIQDLAQYFLQVHYVKMASLLGIEGKKEEVKENITTKEISFADQVRSNGLRKLRLNQPEIFNQHTKSNEKTPYSPEIAIVGVSGRYPQANNLEEFWDILSNGKDCITEIPGNRWDFTTYFDSDKSKPGKTYSKWGGFLNGVDEFDPLFFNISPKEAELLDPQERLFLQCAYETFEDAGYNRESLVAEDTISGSVGVFVGVMYEEYQLFGVEESLKGRNIALFGNPSSIANRVSYFYNFNGPSMAVDTMCSSSLTAIHLACQSILNGDCKAAIAGGVNISVHPNKYLLLAQGKFISSKGRCESFGIGGDGYVPGEGVGAVFLKPLSQALADGDHVYGVIKATSINHGGKTNGYTVPNPNAQAKVIKRAYEKSGIDPRTISYMEAHGTGTSLGDPIEITGLNKAYQEYTKDNNFCAIGSVKSNIGHCESAAGIAGLTKILLQLKYKKLVPSLHSAELNPNIDFEHSPFVVQQNLEDWVRPVIGQNGHAKEYLRRAGISSFGAGGSNAHLVIEEFDDRLYKNTNPQPGEVKEAVLVVLSAKNIERLRELALRLQNVLDKNTYQDSDLLHIAFTLQTGRDALESRMAMVVKSIEELRAHVAAFLGEEEGITGLYRGKIERDNDTIEAFAADEELQEAVEKWIERKKLNKLAEFWVKGLKVDWIKLYKREILEGRSPKKLSLPTYPFARNRYWVPQAENGMLKSDVFIANHSNQMIKSAENKITIEAASEEPYSILTFEESWHELPIDEVSGPSKFASVNLLVCFLSDPAKQNMLTKYLKEINKDIKVIYISNDKISSDHLVHFIEETKSDAYTDVFKRIAGTYGKIDAFLYLWPLEDQKSVENLNPIVYILQAIGKLNLKSNQVLLAGNWYPFSSKSSINNCYLESWIGFTRSLPLVLPETQLSIIFNEAVDHLPEFLNWPGLLRNELHSSKGREVLYKNGQGFTYQIKQNKLQNGPGLIQPGKTYMITGGLGGLGFLFAQHLAEKYQANLILTGRSPLDPQKQFSIDKLKKSGNKVFYLQSDVCDEVKMKEGLTKVKAEIGAIAGLIHAAGTEEEGTILNRSIEQFQSIVSSKIKGTILLDELLKEEALDFVCYFSSSAAVLGDFGSCDYSIGNRFQMAFANYRSQLQKQGLRQGKTLAINWPLWKDGGMNLKEEEITQMYLKSSGQQYLEKNEGIEIFERLLAQPYTHQLVLAGKASRVNQFLKVSPLKQFHKEPLITSNSVGENKIKVRNEIKPVDAEETSGRQSIGLQNEKREVSDSHRDTIRFTEENLEADLVSQISSLLKISKDQLDVQENLADLGFDSVTLTELARSLSKLWAIEVVPALFFSYSTIEKLTQYFIKEHLSEIGKIYESQNNETLEGSEELPAPESPVSSAKPDPVPLPGYEPIAIIGMSGRFPQSRNIEEMWEILAEGRNAVTEIPGERFDWKKYYGGEEIEEGKTNCKWTATIPGISEFDPLFFEISPSEAKAMDPRQRLLLQEGWKALEDAGLGKSHLEKNRVALYVGVEEGKYLDIEEDSATITSNHNAILAARLSYFLNLSGPNMAINTSCSSGLVAAHQAFQSLQNQECDIAVAAGINLLFSPEPYIAMSQAGMLSSDGACHTFDKQANGMVPGEAVAVVVLKRLSKAIADGDPIYATIKGSGLNYDGKTNGITAPSGLSQKELLKSVYDKYQVNAEDVDYIVTHGTGTRLGDPIEINALNDAFKEYTDKQKYCALTSTKTNFGHTFAASGLVSLISLVQAFYKEAIPASLNCKTESDYILWNKSPFFINKSTKPWPEIPGKTRIGGVSSFGMSGTNAHMVLQSYDSEKQRSYNNNLPYYLLPLSAKTTEALDEKINDLIIALEKQADTKMPEISYTLMVGRHHFKHRCIVVAKDLSEAIDILKLAANNQKSDKWLKGEIARGFKQKNEAKEGITDVIRKIGQFRNEPEQLKANLLTLAEFYCLGYELPWERLFSAPIQRIHLPTYPFSREKYWISGNEVKSKSQTSTQEISVSVAKAIEVPLKEIKEESFAPAKEWLIAKEELIESPFPQKLDWNRQLSHYLGKTICIVYKKEEEKEALSDLLRKLEKAGKLTGSLNIKALPYHDISVATVKEILPDVVLLLGARETTSIALQPVESDLSYIFQLSKSLMLAAWDKPVKLYFLYTSGADMPRLDCEALSGFFRSAMKENESQVWKAIRLHEPDSLMAQCQSLLKEWLVEDPTEDNKGRYTEIHLKQGLRFEKRLVETALPAPGKPVFRNNGNYLIIGGMGYIGQQLMQEISKKCKPNIFILARSSYSDKIKEQCEALEKLGAKIQYHSVDVTNFDNLRDIYTAIKKEAKEIHGIINLARAHDTKIIASKSWDSFSKVSQVKIQSAKYLDQLTKDEPLDFFIMFAAMAAFGASGESDYAYSCAFQAAFAKYRNSLTKAGKRLGVAVAQCWGPWDDDKLFPGHADKWTKLGCDLIDMKNAFPLIEATCIYPHGDIGINAVVRRDKIIDWFNIVPERPSIAVNQDFNRFEEIIKKLEKEKREGQMLEVVDLNKFVSVEEIAIMEASLVERLYNLCMQNEQVKEEVKLPSPEALKATEENQTKEAQGSDELLTITQNIKDTVMEVLQVERLDVEEPFQDLGLDSIMAMKLSTRLEKKLNLEVQPQLLIEYPTVKELSAYLSKAHKSVLI